MERGEYEGRQGTLCRVGYMHYLDCCIILHEHTLHLPKLFKVYNLKMYILLCVCYTSIKFLKDGSDMLSLMWLI